MNFKNLLLPVSLAFLTTLAIQYFFMGKPAEQSDDLKSGQQFVAPRTKVEQKPLNVEIDFVDERRSGMAQLTDVQTPLATLVFSTDGATLERLEFKEFNGSTHALPTIFPPAQGERENRCFLLAFQEKTPYFYTLTDKQENDQTVTLTYRYEPGVSGAGAAVTKKFMIFKNTYKIVLEIAVEPFGEAAAGIEPRVVWPSPLMPEIAKDDIIAGIYSDERGTISKVLKDKVELGSGWFAPTLFGSDNKYFVHAMVEDPQKFAQRAYYKMFENKGLISILEGPLVTTSSSWTMSFYFGPKEEQAFIAVDKRLEQILDYYGILAPVSRMMLALLKFLYGYLKNYGFAIIVLTALMKLILLPITLRSERSMKQRLEFQKKLQYIQQRYKNDPETLAQERAELMRKHGFQDMAGCLPLLLQIPMFFALSRILSSSIELYQAPFIFWIKDLSARDPYLILPLLIALTMVVQAGFADKQQRISIFAMALIFGAFTTTLSAGLALYIFISTFLGVAQTAVQKKFSQSSQWV